MELKKMNLLKETLAVINRSGQTPDDICFIGCLPTPEDKERKIKFQAGYTCTWARFCTFADVEYDSGYGSQEVARDLTIVFKDGGQMWRQGYDGSESWCYLPAFVLPKVSQTEPINKLIDEQGYCTLHDMNKEEEDDLVGQEGLIADLAREERKMR